MWCRLVILVILLSSVISEAQTSDLAFSRNARTFETVESTLTMKGMANACLTMTSIPDGLPCNPAMTPFAESSGLNIELQLSNGSSSIKEIQGLLSGSPSQDTIDNVFAQGKIIQVEANADLNFHSKHLNGRYTPISVKGFSVVRNEADPDVDIYAVEEHGFTFQSGTETLNDLYLGAQARVISRKFIKQRFKLTDLGTAQGTQLLLPKSQTATYLEPGLTYFISQAWRPRISVFVANLGFVSQNYDELPAPVEMQAGFGFSPPMEWGQLDLSLEYRSMTYEEEALKKFRLGALYHFGSMYLTGGLDFNGISGGVYYGLQSINAGVVYSTTKYFTDEDEYYTQTVYLQLGWQI